MTGTPPQKIIELTEFKSVFLPKEEISSEVGEILWKKYGTQVAMEPPSFMTTGQWKLTSQGWVGYIPLTPDLGISLQPKISLKNLFGMLEYAYKLKFHFLTGLWDCSSLEEFYERLANVLARRILDRGRKGFYRAYIPRNETAGFIRGRIDLPSALRRPWDTMLRCKYEEHTPDITENQILAWTLSRIARSGVCTERVLPTIRRAYRGLQGLVTMVPHKPRDCSDRKYNRLNEDYQPLHALCRFFLEQSGPSHEMGDRRMLPFLIDMARLYELFVAEWLKVNLPPKFKLKPQERVTVGPEKAVRFDIDLVIYDLETGEAVCVLDTKYKKSATPPSEDVAQVVTYAELKNCHNAVLIYPSSLIEPWSEWVGGKHVRSLSFSIDSDLDEAGHQFLQGLFQIN
jgi:5-methylcytosine-specific restriction enzyme subunit McrC